MNTATHKGIAREINENQGRNCTHLDQIKQAPTAKQIEADHAGGCPQCIAMGSKWLHLRKCLTCGAVGCCDDSPNRHARAHWEVVHHPIIRSIEPGESWGACFADEADLTFE